MVGLAISIASVYSTPKRDSTLLESSTAASESRPNSSKFKLSSIVKSSSVAITSLIAASISDLASSIFHFFTGMLTLCDAKVTSIRRWPLWLVWVMGGCISSVALKWRWSSFSKELWILFSPHAIDTGPWQNGCDETNESATILTRFIASCLDSSMWLTSPSIFASFAFKTVSSRYTWFARARPTVRGRARLKFIMQLMPLVRLP